MTDQAQAMAYTPTLMERFWRKVGFVHHHGEDAPEEFENMPGWMLTTNRIEFGWPDRLRLLLTGKLTFTNVIHHDTPSAMKTHTRLDWQIVPPGAH